MTITAHSAQLEADTIARVSAYLTPEAMRADMAAARERRARWAAEGPAPVTPTSVKPAPAAAPAVRPASEAAINFLASLLTSRQGLTTEGALATAQRVSNLSGARAVSEMIDELKARPTVTPAPTASPAVPAGRYAVENAEGDLRFYKVDRPTEGRWAGYVFVKVQASDEEHDIRGRAAANAILARIEAAGVEAAAVRYGVELQHCYACGRALTDAVSRELGIGPDCRNK